MEFNYKSLIIGLAVTLVWYTFFIYTASYEAAVIAPLVGGYAANYYQKGKYKEGAIYGGLSGATGAFLTALVLSLYNINALYRMGYTDIGNISVELTLVLAIIAGLCMGIAGGLVAGFSFKRRVNKQQTAPEIEDEE
ncbi:MAG: hypothetical protein GKB98_02730 [Methanobacteriales archaeon]|nr:hypothetical protein [Methanobacteriales archaeon]